MPGPKGSWNREAFLFAVSLAVATGCGATRTADDDCGFCPMGLTVNVAPESGTSFGPGTYVFDVAFDATRWSAACTIGEAPREPVAVCDQGWIEPVLEGAFVLGFRITAPNPKGPTVTVRSACPSSELASQTLEPTYTGQCCPRADATVVAKRAPASTSCGDAGAD